MLLTRTRSGSERARAPAEEWTPWLALIYSMLLSLAGPEMAAHPPRAGLVDEIHIIVSR